MLRNMVCILGLFGLATVLAIFQKILGNFIPNHLVTLLANRLAWKKMAVCKHSSSFYRSIGGIETRLAALTPLYFSECQGKNGATTFSQTTLSIMAKLPHAATNVLQFRHLR